MLVPETAWGIVGIVDVANVFDELQLVQWTEQSGLPPPNGGEGLENPSGRDSSLRSVHPADGSFTLCDTVNRPAFLNRRSRWRNDRPKKTMSSRATSPWWRLRRHRRCLRATTCRRMWPNTAATQRRRAKTPPLTLPKQAPSGLREGRCSGSFGTIVYWSSAVLLSCTRLRLCSPRSKCTNAPFPASRFA